MSCGIYVCAYLLIHPSFPAWLLVQLQILESAILFLSEHMTLLSIISLYELTGINLLLIFELRWPTSPSIAYSATSVAKSSFNQPFSLRRPSQIPMNCYCSIRVRIPNGLRGYPGGPP